MSFICVTIESKLISVDGIPLHFDSFEGINFPEGTRCITFDTSTKKGTVEFQDHTSPNQPFSHSQIKPFLTLYKSSVKSKSKEISQVESQSELLELQQPIESAAGGQETYA